MLWITWIRLRGLSHDHFFHTASSNASSTRAQILLIPKKHSDWRKASSAATNSRPCLRLSTALNCTSDGCVQFALEFTNSRGQRLQRSRTMVQYYRQTRSILQAHRNQVNYAISTSIQGPQGRPCTATPFFDQKLRQRAPAPISLAFSSRLLKIGTSGISTHWRVSLHHSP
ncbi:hypothetical protein BC834DRAFT_336777 [Gloeopeniophorella convolvens]|nr:hypothetical protein BC834DRAFT_336777 [Gloeopeniophorella convolvens]